MSDLISRKTAIERAESCTFTDKSEKRKFMDWLKYCLEQPPVEVPQWIPCSERLPEEDETVLCIEGLTGIFYLGRLWNEFDGIRFVDSEGFTICDVDFWMPIPAHPKCGVKRSNE